MKHFKVVMYVTNCNNCPYSDMDGNDNYICTASEADNITRRQIRNENRIEITETCPNFENLTKD